MQKCITNKKMFGSAVIAEDALIEARTKFDYAPNSGPIAVYQCPDCGYYHLTSKGKMNERLAKHLATGKIHLHKEASRWLDKLKDR